jgi:hypothetical protein
MGPRGRGEDARRSRAEEAGDDGRPGRSRLPRDEARARYAEIGQHAALQQIKRDAEALDKRAIAVGPFARLDAGAVAERDGKTRGVISHLFGSQAAFQAETMERALDAGDWIEQLELPAPVDHPDAGAWVEALFAAESARGPRHGARPQVDYGTLWALWLSTVPYGLWSERISEPSMDEHEQWVARLEDAFGEALEHFGLRLREGVALADLAGAAASLIEGAWLNQCLTTHHPSHAGEPSDAFLRRSGRLLWSGATAPRSG